MTNKFGVSLRELLPAQLENLEVIVKSELGKERALNGAGLAWSFLGSKAAEAIQSTLDMDVFKVLAGAWSKARELSKYTDETKYPRGKNHVVHLGEHDLPPLFLYPELQFMLGSLPGPRLRFTLELIAHLRAVALCIRSGHITAIAAGNGFVSTQLKYREINLHDRMESRPIAVGKDGITFDEPGFPISRRALTPK